VVVGSSDHTVECRKLRQAGIDLIEHRKAALAQAALEAAKSMSFEECRGAYIKAQQRVGAMQSVANSG
jgi:hypothetical protein